MIQKLLILFGLAVTLSASHATELTKSQGFTLVDTNTEFKALLEEARPFANSNYTANIPNLFFNDFRNFSTVVELEKAFVFITVSPEGIFEPYSLTKATKVVKPLFTEFTKRQLPLYYYFEHASINRLDNDYALIKADDLFIVTDGTTTNTFEMDLPWFTGYDSVWLYNPGHLAVRKGIKLSIYNLATGKKVEELDVDENSPYYSETSHRRKKFLDNRVDLDAVPPWKVEPLKKATYFSFEDDLGIKVAKIDSINGLKSFFDLKDVPSCSTEEQVSIKKPILESANFIYFSTNPIGARECIYRFDKDNKRFKKLNDLEINARRIQLLGLNGDKIIYSYNTRVSKFLPPIIHVRSFDFDQESSKLLFTPTDKDLLPSESASFEVLAQNEDYLYAYSRITCGNACFDNKLVRISFRDLEIKDFGSRIGFTDQRGDIVVKTGEIYRDRASFILDGDLYFIAGLPYPGLYKLDSSTNRTLLIHSIDGGGGTLKSRFDKVYPYKKGWVGVSSSPLSITTIDFAGNTNSVTFPNDIKNISSIYFSGDIAYFTILNEETLYSLDLNTLTYNLIYENSEEYSNNISVNDHTAYIVGKRRKKTFVFDLVQKNEKNILDKSLLNVFTCGNKTYGLTSNYYSIHETTIDSKGLFIVEETLREVTFDDEDNSIKINLSAVIDDKLFVISKGVHYLYDCINEKVKEIKEPDGYVNPDFAYSGVIAYNKFEKSFYLSRLPGIDFATLSLNEDKWEIGKSGNISLPSAIGGKIVNENGGPSVFTQSGIYILNEVSYLPDVIFKSTKTSMSEIYNFRKDNTFSITVGFRNVSADGRYIVGTYARESTTQINNKSHLTNSGLELFFVDTLTDRIKTLEFFPGIRFGASGHINIWSINNGYLIAGISLPSFNEEFVIIDIACVMENFCNNEFKNRPPSVEAGVTLYYEPGDKITLPIRSKDPDFDRLTFSLDNPPNWLSIDEEGIIFGCIPLNATGQSFEVPVIVSDGVDSVKSEPFIFEIDPQTRRTTEKPCKDLQSFTVLSSNFEAQTGDLNGDGTSEIILLDADGQKLTYENIVSDNVEHLETDVNDEQIPTIGDFDGNGRAEFAVADRKNDAWVVYHSFSDYTVIPFSFQPGDIPVPADYDGDGKTDLAVRRASDHLWIIHYSTSNTIEEIKFGKQTDDIPVPADYDGDGKADLAIRRPSNSTWYVKQSSNGKISRTVFGKQEADIPVPADFDGDGKADFAVRRASNNMWYIKASSNNEILRFKFGLQASDIPAVADYDGDEKADLALFRQSNSTFYILNSATKKIAKHVMEVGENSIPLLAPFRPYENNKMGYH